MPCHRAMATLPKRCLEEIEGLDELDRRPMALMVQIESSKRPPRVSATSGMHSAPTARQAERLEANFRRVPT